VWLFQAAAARGIDSMDEPFQRTRTRGVRRGRGRVKGASVTVPRDGEEFSTRVRLTLAVEAARRGFRRDVAALEAALDDGDLLVPLAQRVAGVPEGEAIPLDRELELVPHFVSDAEGSRHVALFTTSELVSKTAEELGWTTEGEDLGVCSLPARIALDLALDLVDETTIVGLVIDPGHPSELVLRRSELASIVSGNAVPLVGYVADLPLGDDERTLVAEPSEPPPKELTELLGRCIADLPQVTGHRLTRTFNPERDLEPHLTLELAVSADADRRVLAERVIGSVGEHLPPPGYLDIVFADG
jgi:hypothetical protein